jgi:peroxiredoxin
MAAVSPPACDFGWKAQDLELSDTHGRSQSLGSLRGPSGLLFMFICNHCPYVMSIIDRLCRDVAEVQQLGFGVAAVMSNDTLAYPEDSYENMKRLATEYGFTFPYLFDEKQEVARAYGAACTPDFFGFNGNLELQYRGRLDSSGRSPANPETKRELVEAMRQIAATGYGPKSQVASIGCSIKWQRE